MLVHQRVNTKEEKSKAPAPTKAAPLRRLSSKAFSISGSDVADKSASNRSAADMVAALGCSVDDDGVVDLGKWRQFLASDARCSGGHADS